MIRKVMIVLAMASFFAVAAMAEDPSAAPAAVSANAANGMHYIAAALAIGLSVIGGAFAQGRAAAAALEGIARNPSAQKAVFTPMLIALAFMEALGLFGFVIAYLLQGK